MNVFTLAMNDLQPDLKDLNIHTVRTIQTRLSISPPKDWSPWVKVRLLHSKNKNYWRNVFG